MVMKEYKQSVVVMNFISDQSNEDIETMIQEFYIKHQKKKMIGMNVLNLKDNINKFPQIKRICEDTSN